jgi:hypothetical protein
MATAVSEYELEALPELEIHEIAVDGESESEQFFGALANLARRGAHWLTAAASPQRQFALWAARQALSRGLPALGKWAGTHIGGTGGAATGTDYGTRAASWLSSHLPQQEYEAMLEWEAEAVDGGGLAEISPVRKWYPDAMLEHVGHAMAETPSPAEADALAGSLIPLAAQAAPGAAPILMVALPGLVSGLAGMVHGMRGTPSTKPLVRVVPGIVRRTATVVANQAAQGAPVSPQSAVRTLARQTYQVLSRPQTAAQTFRQSQQLDRRFHRAAGISRGCNCPNCGRCAAKVR